MLAEKHLGYRDKIIQIIAYNYEQATISLMAIQNCDEKNIPDVNPGH